MATIAEFLATEHRCCDDVFAAAEDAAHTGDLAGCRARFQQFQATMEHHFQKEEAMLFPSFEQASGNAMGPTRVMRLEHQQMRESLAALDSALAGGDLEDFLGQSVWLLGLGFGAALTVINLALWRAPVASGTVIALCAAHWARCWLRSCWELLLGGYFGWGLSLPIMAITNLHAAWGLVGWTVLLVAGVAYQVVPMFQITPPYPRWLSRGFAPLMAALLVAWSAFALGGWETAALVAGMALAAGLALFAGTTLYLLARRRKIGDPTLSYWRISMVSLLAGATLWLSARWVPALAQAPQVGLLLGILLIFGFAVAVINGMLYKIVPFLAWFHLQAQLFGRVNSNSQFKTF